MRQIHFMLNVEGKFLFQKGGKCWEEEIVVGGKRRLPYFCHKYIDELWFTQVFAINFSINTK